MLNDCGVNNEGSKITRWDLYLVNNYTVAEYTMAFCPKCDQTMGPMDTACPLCGYDFAADPPSNRQQSNAKPSLSSVALVAGTVGAGLGTAWAAIAAVLSLFNGQIQSAVAAMLLALILTGLLGVFLRMSDR